MEKKLNETPGYAQLAAGLTSEDLLDAVVQSGYPFQAVVADRLRSVLEEFSWHSKIQEEWTYIDSESGQARAVDILARIHLGPKGGDRRIPRPAVNLIVECKQSELPFVFFIRESPPDGVRLLRIPGSKNSTIRLYDVSGVRSPSFSFHMPVHDVFHAYEFPFFSLPIPWAISLSKMVRKPKPALTGEESYRSLTLPLLKAASHLESVSASGTSGPSASKSDAPLFITICLAVLRAPMVGVLLRNEKPYLLSFPWFRVTYLEPTDGAGPDSLSTSVRYYDVVHEDFLKDYLTVMMKSMNPLAERMKGHFKEVFEGVGESSDPDRAWETLRPWQGENPDPWIDNYHAEIYREISSFRLPLQMEEHLPDGVIATFTMLLGEDVEFGDQSDESDRE
ncbi:hypothetical protein ACFYTQ_11555 [Nocardia sp. NPDC004068]|uniref:hypothetical protein n=1 Tax=Nocardia sp. NPDC004068 TaxID=3364303 RepID=UPI003683D9A2